MGKAKSLVVEAVMKLLVTGCAGFIGSNFLHWLLETEPTVKVVNLDVLTYAGNLENINGILNHPRHRFVKGDIRDYELVSELVKDKDVIINFGAESHVDRSILGPQAFVETNVNGAFNIFLAATKVNKNARVVQVSTDEVYGSLGPTGKFTETSPLAPSSPYSSTKAAADLLAHAFFTTYKLDTVITRCSNNYGPYQFPEKLIPLMINNAIQDKKLPIYGDGLNVRDWIHVQDHCEGIWAAAVKGRAGEIYNFGSDNEWTNIDIVKKILSLLEKPESLIQYVTDRPGHDRRYAIDASKAREQLGWQPKINFEDGLRQTISWYQREQVWVDHVTSGEYQNYWTTYTEGNQARY